MDGTPKSVGHATALAAITLLESLLVTLKERRLLDDDEIDDIFETAISAHEASEETADASPLPEVVSILKRLHVHGNSLR